MYWWFNQGSFIPIQAVWRAQTVSHVTSWEKWMEFLHLEPGAPKIAPPTSQLYYSKGKIYFTIRFFRPTACMAKNCHVSQLVGWSVLVLGLEKHQVTLPQKCIWMFIVPWGWFCIRVSWKLIHRFLWSLLWIFIVRSSDLCLSVTIRQKCQHNTQDTCVIC